MYFPHSMMIGKALLSGFWECPECLSLAYSTSLLTLDPSHRRFHCCLTTSVATRRCRCWHRSVLCCELLCLDGLLYVISGILARGIPGFRIVLCCFTHTTVWQCDFCVSVFSFLGFAIPIPELIQCCHLTLIDSHWTEPPITFLFAFLVRVFCLVVFLCVMLLLVLFGCLLCFCNGIVTAAGLCTGPIPVHFCGPPPMAAICMH